MLSPGDSAHRSRVTHTTKRPSCTTESHRTAFWTPCSPLRKSLGSTNAYDSATPANATMYSMGEKLHGCGRIVQRTNPKQDTHGSKNNQTKAMRGSTKHRISIYHKIPDIPPYICNVSSREHPSDPLQHAPLMQHHTPHASYEV